MLNGGSLSERNFFTATSSTTKKSLFDTAFLYQNEAVIGKVLHEYFIRGKLERKDVFITTKVGVNSTKPNFFPNLLIVHEVKYIQCKFVSQKLSITLNYKKAKDSFAPAFVNDMQIPVTVSHLDTWHALEKLVDSGKLKAIGLSNFNVKQLQNVYDHARIKPANHQIECHLYWPQTELLELCKKLNISVTAYSPIGSRGRNIECHLYWPQTELLELCKKLNISVTAYSPLGSRGRNTPAQILLRYLIQKGLIVIPKSVKPERVKENINVFDFALDQDDMNKLAAVKTRVRLLLWDVAIGHPFYPFDDVDQSKLKMASIKI
ncbi:unnamed protein product [Strongylus vulgaris]|uniref:NADP-dependent oxidoreductase domain-containing protein n=1 Tax=Strongylus vulgaris TaxID=40348 RepID=A0A3P7J8S2_STRVU|nr:unnamed protein product [Strongylus vulgaris]